jgi:hypothetical protein
MSCDDRYIRQVIGSEKAELANPITRRGRRLELSPLQALHYNDHPDEIIEDFDRSDDGAVLREVERHVIDWERQQTPQQAAWVAGSRQRAYHSPREAARLITTLLRS